MWRDQRQRQRRESRRLTRSWRVSDGGQGRAQDWSFSPRVYVYLFVSRESDWMMRPG